MNLGLADRVFVITGGSSGLGRATAAALAADGARVVISSRDQTRVDTAVTALGPPAVGLALDNADQDAPGRLLEAALSAFGRVDGLLVSVGGPPAGTATRLADDAWRSSFESVFLGAVRLARAFAPHLASSDERPEGGVIAFVLSSSVKAPIPGLSISNGLRPGLAMLAKDLADELGPQGTRVLSLVPGRILTDRIVALEDGNPQARQASEAIIPLRRLGRPREFGVVAAMLMSPAASYVTGCVVPIDGGMIRAL